MTEVARRSGSTSSALGRMTRLACWRLEKVPFLGRPGQREGHLVLNEGRILPAGTDAGQRAGPGPVCIAAPAESGRAAGPA